jgi:hypothetical protein
MPLPREHLIDELATAYVQAVAAAAGATIAVSNRDYGVDGTIEHVVRAGKNKWEGYKYVPAGYPIQYQLKATTTARLQKDYIEYDLNVRNFDLIVDRPREAIPLYLFLVCFGPDAEHWLDFQQEQLVLGATAYWWKQSSSRTKNVSTVRIAIPIEGRLTSKAMTDLLDETKARFRPL